ncbi:minor capsid protein, partial [Parabacteroides distasonis]|nr:capsid protein [Parabacteroides distasonis]
MANAQIIIELDGVKAKTSQQNMNRGQFTMANQMLADMDQYIPYDEGTLTGSGMVES